MIDKGEEGAIIAARNGTQTTTGVQCSGDTTGSFPSRLTCVIPGYAENRVVV
jgi:hypothetical protein